MRKKNIFDDMNDLHREMERMFIGLFNPKHPFQVLADRSWKPLMDVYELKDEIIIKVEVPGVDKNEITITAEDKQLIIRGTRKYPHQTPGITYHQMEINYGDFERIIVLPKAYSADHINAELKDGFLCIKITKSKNPD